MLRLLHLSDLHLGEHSRLAGQDHAKAGKSFHRALVAAEPSLGTGQRVDVVVVTGDLAEVGNPEEFELAHQFLRALAGELGWSIDGSCSVLVITMCRGRSVRWRS